MNIEKVAEKEGIKVAKIIYSKYGKDPIVKHKSIFKAFFDNLLGGSLTNSKIRNEVYEGSLYRANVFFSEYKDRKNDESILKVLRSRLSQRLVNKKEMKNTTPEELLANVIKIEALDFLLEKGIVY